MENQDDEESFIFIEPHPFMASLEFYRMVFGILWKAVTIIIRNGKPLVSIFILASLSFSLLALGGDQLTTPLLKDLRLRLVLLDQYRDNTDHEVAVTPYFTLDIGLIMALLSSMAVNFWVMSHLFLIATISSTSEAVAGKVLTPKDLFFKAIRCWKGPVITSLYMTVISVFIFSHFVILVGAVSPLAEGFSAFLLEVAALILVATPCIYVAAVWMLSLVISVVEDDSIGLKAINRAGVLMKGKRLEAYVLVLILIVNCGTLYITRFVIAAMDGPPFVVTWSHPAIRTSLISLQCLIMLYMFVAFTVFYHECKKSNEKAHEKGKAEPLVPIYEER